MRNHGMRTCLPSAQEGFLTCPNGEDPCHISIIQINYSLYNRTLELWPGQPPHHRILHQPPIQTAALHQGAIPDALRKRTGHDAAPVHIVPQRSLHVGGDGRSETAVHVWAASARQPPHDVPREECNGLPAEIAV